MIQAPVFNLEQADMIAKTAEPILRDAVQIKRQIESIAAKYGYDEAILERERPRIEKLAQQLSYAIDALEKEGVYVKDLDTGILHILTIFEGKEVFFCYRLGEGQIRRHHRVTEQCRGDKNIVDLDHPRDAEDNLELRPEAKAEIERRIKRMLSGQAKTYTTAEVKKMLFDKKR